MWAPVGPQTTSLLLFLDGIGYKPLSVHRACSFLKMAVAAIGLNLDISFFILLGEVGYPGLCSGQ